MGDPGASKAFAEWNDRMAHLYDPEDYHLRSGAVVRLIEGRRIAAAIRLLAPREGHRILEVGCGAGNLLEKVPRAWLAGIDLSPFLLEKSQRRLERRGVALARADAERLPFCGGSFDGVLCSEVLEHVMHPTVVLEEMLRVAKPEGRVVITVPNEPLINRLKEALGSLGLLRLVIRGKYKSVQRMDEEWHLHSLDLPASLAMVPATARVERVVCVPSRLLPLRYALLLRPR